MSDKMEQILQLVAEYIKEKRQVESWKRGEWIKYSGSNFDENEYQQVIKTLLKEWLVLGEKTSEFENKFPEYLGKKMGTFTNSGSSANLLMVSSLTSRNKMPKKYRIEKGSKFITPIVCFPTTINPLLQNGFVPLFVDVDIPSLNLNLDKVEEELKNDKDKTIKGIIFAHVLGNPPDMDRLMSLVEKYDLIFLEDACDALGSFYKGKRLGSFGDMSTCSFYPAHHMTTGEGGFVATNNMAIKRTISSFRDWGRSCYCNISKPGDVTCGTACGDRFRSWLPGCREETYDHRYVYDEIGYNLKPIEIQAVMGLEQIKKLPDMEHARRQNFKKLYSIFRKYENFFHLPHATKDSDPCWFGFLLLVKDNPYFKKQDFVNFMESRKIQTRSYFAGNILYHPAYNSIYDGKEELRLKFPNAHFATISSVFLGTHIGYTQEKIDYIQDCIDEFMSSKVK